MELTVLRFLGLEVDEGDRPKTGLTVRLVVGTWSGRDGPNVGEHVGGAGRLPEGEAKHLQTVLTAKNDLSPINQQGHFCYKFKQ